MTKVKERSVCKEHRWAVSPHAVFGVEISVPVPEGGTACGAVTPEPMPRALFDEVYDKYAARMGRLARQITRDEADAEDAVQDAFLRIFENYGSFRHESGLWTWIYRVTQTSALMILRRRRSTERTTDAVQDAWRSREQMSWNSTPEKVLVQLRKADAVQEAVDRLIPSVRPAMNAYLREGLNQQELCDRYRLTPAALKARLHRARTSLRARLKREFAPGA